VSDFFPQPDPPFDLGPVDRASPLWRRLEGWLASELDNARRRNDATRPELDTAMLRGEIRAIKRFLALGQDRPILTDSGEDTPRGVSGLWSNS
jgi:hypothetical protein